MRLLSSSRLPILPFHGINVFVDTGDGARFVDLFKHTWARVPESARTDITEYWRRQDLASRLGVVMPPLIAMFSDCPELELRPHRGRSGRKAFACVTSAGFALYFRPSIVQAMGKDVVCTLIAHELAHVFDFAAQVSEALTRDPAADPLACLRRYDSLHDEIDTAGLLSDWGFDDSLIRQWTIWAAQNHREKTRCDWVAER
jgi:hypothetical protein